MLITFNFLIGIEQEVITNFTSDSKPMDFMRVLVVDDIFTNRLLLAEIIEASGNEVVLVENGQEAIDLLSKQEFHLIFMDIEMPVMDGVKATRYIRDNMPQPLNVIPIIAITAHDTSQYFEKFSDAGFTDLISKPYSVENILSVLRNF